MLCIVTQCPHLSCCGCEVPSRTKCFICWGLGPQLVGLLTESRRGCEGSNPISRLIQQWFENLLASLGGDEHFHGGTLLGELEQGEDVLEIPTLFWASLWLPLLPGWSPGKRIMSLRPTWTMWLDPVSKIYGFWSWSHGSAVKSTDCSCRRPRFSSQHTHSSSQPSVTPVPTALAPPRVPVVWVDTCIHADSYT